MATLPQKTFYQDGDYSTPQKIYESAKTYPFMGDGDISTYLYQKRYVVNAISYTPTIWGTPDPEDATAYLVRETEPVKERTALATFERTYSRKPATIEKAKSLQYAMPQISGLPFTSLSDVVASYGTSGTISPTMLPSSADLYTRKVVSADSGAFTGPTGGTFTLSFPSKRYDINLVTNSMPFVDSETTDWALGTNGTGKVATLAAGVDPNRPIGGASLTLAIASGLGAVGNGLTFNANHLRSGVRIPVTAALRYQASVYLSTVLCGGRIMVDFYNSGGSVLSTATGSEINQTLSTGKLSSWQRSSVFVTAPALAVTALVYVQAIGKGVAGPAAHFAGVYFGEAELSQTTLSNWSAYDGDLWKTANIAYNASTATILTAIQGLAGYGGLTVNSVSGGTANGSINYAFLTGASFANYNTAMVTCAAAAPIAISASNGRVYGSFVNNRTFLTAHYSVSVSATHSLSYNDYEGIIYVYRGLTPASTPFTLTINGASETFSFTEDNSESLASKINGILPSGYFCKFAIGGTGYDTAFYISPDLGGSYKVDLLGRKVIVPLSKTLDYTDALSDLFPEISIDLVASAARDGRSLAYDFTYSIPPLSIPLACDPALLTAGTWAAESKAIGTVIIFISAALVGFQRKLTISPTSLPHNIANTDTLLIDRGVNTSSVTLSSGQFNVDSENVISVDPSIVTVTSPYTSIGRLVMKYDTRTVRVRTREEKEFFLVSPNGVTMDSVLPNSNGLSSFDLFKAMFNGDSEVLYEESDIEQWMGPIYHKTKTYFKIRDL
jgi:hypothetical protein